MKIKMRQLMADWHDICCKRTPVEANADKKRGLPWVKWMMMVLFMIRPDEVAWLTRLILSINFICRGWSFHV